MDARVSEIEQLYRNRFQAFWRGLVPVTGSYEAARDAVQEGFARALRERDQFRGEGSLEGWVWRIVFRVALEQRGGRDVQLDDALLEPFLVPEPERDPELVAALRTLPPRRRLVVFLRYFADLSYAEIATTCDISEGTVAATLAHAHSELASALKAKEQANE